WLLGASGASSLFCASLPRAAILRRTCIDHTEAGEQRFQVKTGTIVDATLIGAPSSTKNADKKRDC
nr:hypothetical protein [Pseudomonadota bacterium]